ncbi:MAG TPA: DUF2017 family protein [Planctomycetota bacterium]|nr:DUF2017 family protein [Planctomycetota bacterium]
MNFPSIEVEADGSLLFRHLAAGYARALREVPDILLDDSEDVRVRLFPNSYVDDPEREADWERYSKPDLIALFESRRAIVARDLDSLSPEPVWSGYSLRIPESHRSAWMAALNAARVAIGVRAGIDAADMEAELDFDPPDAKQLALYRIHVLGHVLALVVASFQEDFSVADFDEDDDLDEEDDDDLDFDFEDDDDDLEDDDLEDDDLEDDDLEDDGSPRSWT